jgi:hypothetical protein
MRINDILVESTQTNEGPLLNKLGDLVGKGVGTVAKGAGAVAGGIAGIGTAAKKGFQAGKASVASAGDDEYDDEPVSSQSTYAQVKSDVARLDKKGKIRILNLLKKSLGIDDSTRATPSPETGMQPAAKPSQAEIDADRERLMGPNSESTVRTGKVVAESFSLYRKQ